MEKKLINFCDKRLTTQIVCDKPCSDGFEVGNLLLTSEMSCGFLAFACLKPPVNISITFPCQIALNRVLIDGNVGAQRSTGFRISVPAPGGGFRDISTGIITNREPGILFCHRNQTDLAQEYPTMATAHFTNRFNLSHVSQLRISIIKTDKSVPGIRNLQVWGSVSTRNGRRTLEEVHRLLVMREEQDLGANKPSTSASEDLQSDLKDSKMGAASTSTAKDSDQRVSSLDVPEEFLDPITWNIMVQPIILPSGKIIDQSTLENFSQNEANWGRSLSDPFTSIPFSQNYRPVFASALKAQIDRFLTDNAIHPEVQQLPRVLGCPADINAPKNRPLDLAMVSAGSKSSALVPSDKNQFVRRVDALPGMGNRPEGSRHSLPSVMTSRSSHMRVKRKREEEPTLQADANDLEIVFDSRSSQDERNPCQIDEELKTSLKSMLSGLKRFEEHNLTDDAAKCNCCDAPSWYQLPCSHKICRNQLQKDQECPDCKKKYKNCQVFKLNV